MEIETKSLPYPISSKLIQLIESLTAAETGENLTINFKDESYSSESGGYHPVEIRVSHGLIQYITDFSYVGTGWAAELAKELDFDFTNGLFGMVHFPDRPIIGSKDLFNLWQTNFVEYVDMDVFKITVTSD